jgi:hypothetical protein
VTTQEDEIDLIKRLHRCVDEWREDSGGMGVASERRDDGQVPSWVLGKYLLPTFELGLLLHRTGEQGRTSPSLRVERLEDEDVILMACAWADRVTDGFLDFVNAWGHDD